jgi:hypothetical protein
MSSIASCVIGRHRDHEIPSRPTLCVSALFSIPLISNSLSRQTNLALTAATMPSWIAPETPANPSHHQHRRRMPSIRPHRPSPLTRLPLSFIGRRPHVCSPPPLLPLPLRPSAGSTLSPAISHQKQATVESRALSSHRAGLCNTSHVAYLVPFTSSSHSSRSTSHSRPPFPCCPPHRAVTPNVLQSPFIPHPRR